MSLGGKQGLIFLGRQDCIWFTDGGSAVLNLKFPQEVVVAEEILDVEKFAGLIAEFVKNNQLESTTWTIVLSAEILFANMTEEKEEIFLGKLPFSPEEIGSKSVEMAGKQVLVATNKEYYQKLKLAIENGGGKVRAVVPVLSWGQEVMSQEVARMILKDRRRVNKNNFLENKEENHKPWGILGLIVLVGLLALAYRLEGEKIMGLVRPEEQALRVATPTEIALPSLEPSKTEVVKKTKEEMVVLVLNGTGTRGDAGKIKEVVLSVGFSQIETGNSAEQTKKTTTVSFGEGVGLEEREEILAELEKAVIGTVESIEASSSAKDITITTGPLK